jgi:hypothetical protein
MNYFKKITAFVLICIIVVAPSSSIIASASTNRGNTLFASSSRVNNRLESGSFLVSDNGMFYARMQHDGNFVIYRGAGTNPADAVWSTGTHGKGNPGRSYFELRDGKVRVRGHVMFQLHTTRWNKTARDATRLVMANNGSLIAYRANGTIAWQSGAVIKKCSACTAVRDTVLTGVGIFFLHILYAFADYPIERVVNDPAMIVIRDKYHDNLDNIGAICTCP